MKINENYFNINQIKAKMIEEDIVVNYYDGDSVYLNYNGDFNSKISIIVHANELIIERKLSLESLICIKISKGILQLFIPKKNMLDLNLKSNSGHIQVYVDAKNLLVETTSGRIESHGVGYHAYLHTVSGRICQYRPYDCLEFKTISGSVKLTGKMNCSYSGSTVSGSVLVSMDNCNDYQVNFKTTSGRYKNKYTDSTVNESVKLVREKGQPKLNIKTISGNLKLDRWA